MHTPFLINSLGDPLSKTDWGESLSFKEVEQKQEMR